MSCYVILCHHLPGSSKSHLSEIHLAMSYRFDDEARIFDRETKTLLSRVVTALGNKQLMSFQNEANHQWPELMKRFATLAQQAQRIGDSIAQSSTTAFTGYVFTPASQQFNHELLFSLSIRPSREIELLALRQLQDFIDAELASGRLVVPASTEDELLEEAIAMESYQKHTQESIQQARTAALQQCIASGLPAGAAINNAETACVLSAQNTPRPWTAQQRKAIASLNLTQLATRVDQMNSAISQLQRTVDDALPSTDSILSAVQQRKRVADEHIAAIARPEAVTTKKNSMLAAMFLGQGL